MIEPTQADIGRRVGYTPSGRDPGEHTDVGVLTSFNDSFVFVRFGTGDTSAACLRENLDWLEQTDAQ